MDQYEIEDAANLMKEIDLKKSAQKIDDKSPFSETAEDDEFVSDCFDYKYDIDETTLKRCPNNGDILSAARVVITHADTPDHFWLRFLDSKNIDNCVEFEKTMGKFYDDAKKLCKLSKSSIVVGSCCVAKSLGSYVRCKITHIVNTEKVKVHLVDWGRDETVNVNDLYALTRRFSDVAELAAEARLYAIAPKNKFWTREGVKLFDDLTHVETMYGVFVNAKKSYESNVLLVCNLCDTTKEENQLWIREELIYHGHARPVADVASDYKLNESKNF